MSGHTSKVAGQSQFIHGDVVLDKVELQGAHGTITGSLTKSIGVVKLTLTCLQHIHPCEPQRYIGTI